MVAWDILQFIDVLVKVTAEYVFTVRLNYSDFNFVGRLVSYFAYFIVIRYKFHFLFRKPPFSPNFKTHFFNFLPQSTPKELLKLPKVPQILQNIHRGSLNVFLIIDAPPLFDEQIHPQPRLEDEIAAAGYGRIFSEAEEGADERKESFVEEEKVRFLETRRGKREALGNLERGRRRRDGEEVGVLEGTE